MADAPITSRGLAGLHKCLDMEEKALAQAEFEAGGVLCDRRVGAAIERYRRACLALIPFEIPRKRWTRADANSESRDLDSALKDREALEKLRDVIDAALEEGEDGGGIRSDEGDGGSL